MNDNQAIINKIISDAESFAFATVQSAEAQAVQAEENAKNLVAEQTFAEGENAKKDGEELLARRVTIARLDAKKNILKAKQQIVTDVFELVLQKLCSAPKDRYFQFVQKGVAKYAEKGDTIILSENAPFEASELENTLSAYGVTVKKQGKFKGGAIVSGEKRDTDLSFEAIVADYYEKCSGEVARTIFGDE